MACTDGLTLRNEYDVANSALHLARVHMESHPGETVAQRIWIFETAREDWILAARAKTKHNATCAVCASELRRVQHAEHHLFVPGLAHLTHKFGSGKS